MWLVPFAQCSKLILGLATCNFQNPAFKNGCLNDLSWSLYSNDSTSFAFYTRTANVAYSLSNYSILSINDLSEASPAESILPSDLFPILDKFFAPVSSSDSVVELSLTDTLINYLYFDNYKPSVFGGTYYFQSILTWPVISFQVNDMNYNKPDIYDVPIPDLPNELYVTGQFAQSVNRIFISKWTVVIFMLIGGGIYIWCLAWLAWAMAIDNPGFGHFPIIDFASRIASAGVNENSAVNVIRRSVSRRRRSGIRRDFRRATELPSQTLRVAAGRKLRSRKVQKTPSPQAPGLVHNRVRLRRRTPPCSRWRKSTEETTGYQRGTTHRGDTRRQCDRGRRPRSRTNARSSSSNGRSLRG